MPKPSKGVEAFVGAGRIRKRGCSSSSSSSSVLQNCRLKRAVLVAKRGGASTPSPAWKIEVGSPSSASEVTRCQRQAGSDSGSREKKQGPVSARKLASALWELQQVPSPPAQGQRLKAETGRDYLTKLPSYLSDPSHSPCSEVADRASYGLHRRRGSPLVSQKSRLRGHNNSSLDSISNGSSMEIEKQSRSITPVTSVGKAQTCLKDLKKSLHASKELLKTVKRFQQIEEHHSSSVTPIISALETELERARLQVNYLTESSTDLDISHLRQRFVEEKMVWKKKLQERIKDAIQSVVEELEIEKKLRRRADRLNEKLMMEVTEIKTALARTSEELENERKQREVIEQVCDELVKGIGEDRAEMEKMKEESAKVREELEREREMLQLADIWREERVQMKLSEAKYHLEEKNAAVDQLRHELETYLANKRSKDQLTGHGNVKDDITEVESQESRDRGGGCLRNMTNAGEPEGNNSLENADLENADASSVDDDELGSEDSDLHSIELSVDNISKSYRWNFSAADLQRDVGQSQPRDCNSKERSSTGREKSGSRFPHDDAPGCSHWSFDGRDLQDSVDGLDFVRELDNDGNKFHDQDAQRYKSVKGLRDQMLSACKIASARGLASPTRMWIQPRRSLDCGDHVLVGSKISKAGKAVVDSESKEAEVGGYREKSCNFMSKTEAVG